MVSLKVIRGLQLDMWHVRERMTVWQRPAPCTSPLQVPIRKRSHLLRESSRAYCVACGTVCCPMALWDEILAPHVSPAARFSLPVPASWKKQGFIASIANLSPREKRVVYSNSSTEMRKKYLGITHRTAAWQQVGLSNHLWYIPPRAPPRLLSFITGLFT